MDSIRYGRRRYARKIYYFLLEQVILERNVHIPKCVLCKFSSTENVQCGVKSSPSLNFVPLFFIKLKSYELCNKTVQKEFVYSTIEFRLDIEVLYAYGASHT